MIECLSEIGMDEKDLQIITKLYWEQSTSVRTESGMTSGFKINEYDKAVNYNQICSIYTLRKYSEVEDMKGVNIAGVNINNLRYADDPLLLAEGPMFLGPY